MFDASDVLTYPETYYNPAAIRAGIQSGQITTQAAAREYRRLRKIAKQRIKRFAAANVKADIVNDLQEAIKDSMFTVHNLANLARVMTLSTSTLRGYRAANRARVKTLRARGYDFITEENIDEFGRFMESVAESRLSAVQGSIAVADMYAAAKKANISTDKLVKALSDWRNSDTETQQFLIQQVQPVKLAQVKKARKRLGV